MRLISDMISMAGRGALITGGSGHIARAIAEAFLEQGCRVLLADRTAESLETARAALQGKFPGAVVDTMVTDLESEQQREFLAKSLPERLGSLHVLVNNAAFVGDSSLKGWVAPFEEQSIDTWRRAIEVNLTAGFHLSQLCADLLRKSGKGSIVNIGSIYGVVGPDMSLYDGTRMGNPAAYAVSKGGVVQMTRWLATVLAPDIRVNCISPGGVQRGQPSSFVESYVARTPLRRMGSEEDFKGAALYFASDMSSWVTGENLMVDGGWTQW